MKSERAGFVTLQAHISQAHLATVRLPAVGRYGLSFVFGAVAALALAPFYFLFLLVPAFCGLLWLIYGATRPRAAFAIAWWFGLGHFAAGLYWIANALLVDAARFGWLIPFAILGLSGGLAVFPALAGFAARRIAGGYGGVGRVLVFTALWVVLEWVRGWIFTGFPWNLTGSSWAVSDALMQMGSVTGIYGLSLLAVLTAAMPATLAAGDGWGGGRRPTLVAGAILALIWGGGAIRLSEAPALGTDNVPNVRLRLVQPNIAQADKWRADLRIPNLKEQLRMSLTPAVGPAPTHVIWSETAATFFLSNDVAVRRAIAAATPKGGLIITGAPRTTAVGKKPFRAWNSLFALDDKGKVVSTYDKHHLVPFGEYMPFRGIINLDKITAGSTDFTPGPGPRTLRLPGLPAVSPLICYEVIFPGNVVNAADRPKWMLNLTNDAWYGISTGPYQHFDAARFRAVEEGLPLVRVANTGISGVIDAYGRVVRHLKLGEKATLDSALPTALPPTVYSRSGNAVALLLIAIILAAGIFAGRLRPASFVEP